MAVATPSRAAELKQALQTTRETMDTHHATRLHRAISWLRCAETHGETDPDMAFIALWIAFNSCYTIDDDQTQRTFWSDFQQLAGKLTELDKDKRIYNCLWMNYSNFVRLLIDNQYVYGPFWDSQRNGDDDWRPRFERDRQDAMRALANNNVALLLRIVMNRLYTLRNQLMHGGATWQSRVNRDQVNDGRRMLMELIPIMIEIMFDDSMDWGAICYPVIEV